MRRRIFTILSALSLLVFLSTAVMWVCSYWYEPVWALRARKDSGRFLVCSFGRIRWVTQDVVPLTPSASGYDVSNYRLVKLGPMHISGGIGMGGETISPPRDPPHSFLGLGWGHSSMTDIGPARLDMTQAPSLVVHVGTGVVPCWFAALVSVGLPAIWIRREMGERRRRLVGHCLRCGYDLRASKERCPECGTEIEATDPDVIGTGSV